jgi:hypothetical protein
VAAHLALLLKARAAVSDKEAAALSVWPPWRANPALALSDSDAIFGAFPEFTEYAACGV